MLSPVRFRSTTCATLFAGGGGWEGGAIAARVRPLWSVELEPTIGEVLEHNLSLAAPRHRTLISSVLDIDPTRLASQPDMHPDILIASPPCPGFSQARMRGGVCEREDTQLGSVIIRFVRVFRPRVVLVENVHFYRRDPVFLRLIDDLRKAGYYVDYEIVNADEHGVPSSRRRLIARASRDPLPPWPESQRPISWLESVRDILDTFPPDELADWQDVRVKRLVKHRAEYPLKYPWLISSNDVSSQRFAEGKVVRVARGADEPAFTIASTYKAMSRTRVLYKSGRVTQVTPRGFARFQSFPDDYDLPKSAALAVKVVGNAVPPALSQALIESFL